MAKDITCTQVRVNNGVSDCNAEENIEFKFSFDIKLKLTEEITEEFDKQIKGKIKEVEDKVTQQIDSIQKNISTTTQQIDLIKGLLNTKDKLKETIEIPLGTPEWLKKIIEAGKEQIEKLGDKIPQLEEDKNKLEQEIVKLKRDLDEGKIKITEALDKDKADKIAEIPNLIVPILDAIKVNLLIDESIVVKDIRTIQKTLKTVSASKTTAGDAEATTELVFPEALAGAKLKINYAFEYTSTADVRKVNIAAGVESCIDIKRAGGAVEEIYKVYWSENEHAKWGAELTVQKELCKNETGFLHVYTKGLFGKEVFIEDYGDGGSFQILGIPKATIMKDNVVSIAYSMSDAFSRYEAEYIKATPGSATFTGDKIDFSVATSKTNPLTDNKDSGILTLLCNKDAANPQQPTVGTDVKVKITTDEEAIQEPTKAKCILQFRPDNTYIGDYGFDWVRLGDTTGAPGGHHHDYDFENHMGKHYYSATMKVESDGNKYGNSFKKDKDSNQTGDNAKDVLDFSTGSVDTTFGDGKMYNRLRLRYRRLLFDWDPKDATKSQCEIYTSIMTCPYPLTEMDASGNLIPKRIKLDLLIDIKTEPKKITFEFDNNTANNYLDIKVPASKEITAGLAGPKVTEKMEIECKGEFAQEYTLKARVFKKDAVDGTIDTKGEICGMLRILPNASMYQRKVKIMLVSVWTKLNGSVKKGNNKKGKERIKEILGQALISANEMIEVDIDTETDPNFVTDFCKDDGSGVFNVIDDDQTRGWNMRTYLLNKLGDEYKHNYKIYFFNEKENNSNGYSWGEKYICVFNTANEETAAHELLHGLGLAHPFDAASKNTKFIYEYAKTDNVMDYTHHLHKTRRSLFHWQWQIINSKIR